MSEHVNNDPKTSNLRVVFFVSRNKDNKYLEEYTQRKKAFVSSRDLDDARLLAEFSAFVDSGVGGEMSRMYVSVNRRDNNKVVKELQHYLLDHPDTAVAGMQSKLASLAALKQNALDSKWLFDYDDDKSNLQDFLSDLARCGLKEDEVAVHDTPHGAAVVVDHGFDTRELLAKWPKVELKRDDMLLVKWAVKHNTQF